MMFIFFFSLKSEVDQWSSLFPNFVNPSDDSSLLCHIALINPQFLLTLLEGQRYHVFYKPSF